ncbi:heme o synthase [Sediminibacillus albus]|uniref:Protoheme IX farnesyltransferase n=1 Tax=Sediminibacillus albus TaxID=407036 RepID=A0A1G8WA24_9BACI|nr:heme o synthase [Sediminibacillus albus]SDJ74996.1 protoheme IX farnesyltransferase [Sediminibacillus albus]
MNKVEATSSQVIGKTDSKDKSALWADIMALIKVGIINSNLITAFAGFWLALYFTGGALTDHWGSLIIMMLGTALLIAGGCILNNYYDRDIDPIMKRTKNRPTVTGSIPLKVILAMGISASAVGAILLALTTIQAAVAGIVGWFTYVVLYTMWTKRRYTINTAIGSVSGAVPPVIGWAAVDPNFHAVAFIMFLIMFLWQTPHFLALAVKKSKEYKAAGIPMLPAVHGFAITRRQMVIYVACLLPLPFYLFSLGNTFLVIACLLNIGWLVLGISGFFMKNNLKWANFMFVYSLNYLMIMFVTMVLVTLPSVVN